MPATEEGMLTHTKRNFGEMAQEGRGASRQELLAMKDIDLRSHFAWHGLREYATQRVPSQKMPEPKESPLSTDGAERDCDLP